MQRTILYQGAIVRDDHILLIQHRHYATGHSYWLLPGGGLEGEEIPEVCVQREVREETHLHVQVGQHLLDDPDMPGGTYQRLHTYLCRVLDGEAQPGYEPEEEAAEDYAIVAVRWLDLRQPTAWGMDVQSDRSLIRCCNACAQPWAIPRRNMTAPGAEQAERHGVLDKVAV